MTLIASLPMYDFPEVREALATIWAGVARRLEREGARDVPPRLVHDRALGELWSDPALLLSQCCGYDCIQRFVGKLRPVATPRYCAPGCEGSHYASVVLVGDRHAATELAQLRGSVCVINSPESHSGMNALRALVAPHCRGGRFFSEVRVSGAHATSIAALAGGEADVTAIDCVTYALLERHRPGSLRGTRRLCYTERAPGIPYVTRSDVGEALFERLQRALIEAFEDEGVKSAAREVFIEGIDILPLEAYERMRDFERAALQHRYPELL